MGAKVNSIRNARREDAFFQALPLRERCIWAIGIDTGLRISDILKIKKHQIRAGQWVGIDQKTKKKNKLRVTKETQRLCEAYAKVNHNKGKQLLFYHKTKKTNTYTRQNVYYHFTKAARAAGLENIGTHSARATAAWKTFKASGDINVVKKLLNHTDTTTTKIYLKNKRKKAS